MSSADDRSTPPHQQDRDRRDPFPSGDWIGFFIQPGSRQRHTMQMELSFATESISGSGDDAIGDFAITGTFDALSGECSWTKQYAEAHEVQYVGVAREGGIVGQWLILDQPKAWSGPFFVWPRVRGDLQPVFERVFIEYDLASSYNHDPDETAE